MSCKVKKKNSPTAGPVVSSVHGRFCQPPLKKSCLPKRAECVKQDIIEELIEWFIYFRVPVGSFRHRQVHNFAIKFPLSCSICLECFTGFLTLVFFSRTDTIFLPSDQNKTMLLCRHFSACIVSRVTTWLFLLLQEGTCLQAIYCIVHFCFEIAYNHGLFSLKVVSQPLLR